MLSYDSYAPFARERGFDSTDLLSHGLTHLIKSPKILRMLTSETLRDETKKELMAMMDISSHLERLELLHVLMQNLLIHWDGTRMGKIHVVV